MAIGLMDKLAAFPFSLAHGPCYVIAEIGVNHGGNVELAKRMIVSAKEAGADAVKFQTFTAAALVTQNTPKVDYQSRTTSKDESHYEMIRSLELSHEGHFQLFQFCEQVGIDFISTPYDLESAQFLETLGVKLYKTASADIVDLPLHRFLSKTGKWVIAATGMSSLGEVEAMVEIYRTEKKSPLALLHCVSNYPCSDEGLNLKALSLLADTFRIPIGFSDHSVGALAASLSVAMGARIIEKHFTLDKNMPGPDHQASSTPDEFKVLVKEIRRAELMLGERHKFCQPEERQMALVSRKSWVLAHSVVAGQILTESNLVMKRPGTGLTAVELPRMLGKRYRRDFPANHLIKFEDLE